MSSSGWLFGPLSTPVRFRGEIRTSTCDPKWFQKQPNEYLDAELKMYKQISTAKRMALVNETFSTSVHHHHHQHARDSGGSPRSPNTSRSDSGEPFSYSPTTPNYDNTDDDDDFPDPPLLPTTATPVRGI